MSMHQRLRRLERRLRRRGRCPCRGLYAETLVLKSAGARAKPEGCPRCGRVGPPGCIKVLIDVDVERILRGPEP
jgi:hypothetical protein